MPFETITYVKVADVATLTLNRPDKLNAINPCMSLEIEKAIAEARDDDEIRVVILKGAGENAFCAGADLSEFLTAPSPVVARQVRQDNSPDPDPDADHGVPGGEAGRR
jgi:enoyl-CoA hydratase/carnithine racemase